MSLNEEEKTGSTEGIAITGLSCRFPGEATNVKAFWDSLCRGESAWSEIPKERFDRHAFGPKIPQGAHFLKQDVAAFDAPFFAITAAEARAMDPQQRISLEVVYEALESAGYPLNSLRDTRTGVFMGQLTSDYQELVCRDIDAVVTSKFSLTGLQRTSLANRVSWLFDLKGPSFTLDTACSSSLTALHLACESLASGESDIAIVGGCNVIINPDMFICLGGQGFLAPDGKCKAFDASADGYGRGEGVAAVVLRRFSDAARCGDPVRAVIRGTGINQDGNTKGFTLPSAEAQATLIHDVYKKCGLDFSQTGYVEAHGTGTKAGDLEETTALGRTLSPACKNKKLMIGSVKTNIGHLEAAAGLAGLIKSVLILETAMIPPNIHFHDPNTTINFEDLKLSVPTRLIPWPYYSDTQPQLRRISINSFGYGGANAHAILDDAASFHSHKAVLGLRGNTRSQPMSSRPSARTRLFVISAQDKDGLSRVKKSLGAFLLGKLPDIMSQDLLDQEHYLQSLAYTLGERRSPLQWKTYAVASSLQELVHAIEPQSTGIEAENDSSTPPPQILSSRPPIIGFVFTGQGAQWATMGIQLMDSFPCFRSSVEEADRFLLNEAGCKWSVIEELSRGKSTSKLNRAEYSQALCTILQVALVDLLREWNITPQAVIGHSSGEIAAAYCWGVLSRQDSWRIAYFRGLLSSQMREDWGLQGAMMAVGSSPEEVEKMISELQAHLLQEGDGEAHVACINSPRSVTVSGDVGAIEKLQEALQKKAIFARKLQVDTAYHSPHMEMMASDYYQAISEISVNSPRYPNMKMYSSVSGDLVDSSELGPAYWIRNAVSPVQFASAVQNLVRGFDGVDVSAKIDVLVEVGPHSALLGPTTQSLAAIGWTNIPYYSALTRFKNATETALHLAGSLYTRGYSVNFRKVNGELEGTKSEVQVDLPSYPWNHSQKHWAESRIGKEYRLREAPISALLGPPYPSTVAGEYVWRGFVRLSDEAWSSWLPDHKISGSVVCPGAGFIAMAIEAARSLAFSAASGPELTQKKPSAVRLRDINLISALVVNPDEEIEYTVSLRPFTDSVRDTTAVWSEFTITSCRDDRVLNKNCSGLVMLEYGPFQCEEDGRIATEAHLAATESCTTAVNPEDLYQSLSNAGLQLGHTFRNLTAVAIGMGQSCSTVKVPNIGLTNASKRQVRPHLIHPVVLDAIFQSAFAALVMENRNALSTAMVPKVIDDIVISTDIPWGAASAVTGFANAARHGFKEIMADITIFQDGQQQPVLQISGFCCSEVAGAASGQGVDEAAAGGTGEVDARCLMSKIIRRPALQFLSPDEQKHLIEGPHADLDKATISDSTLRSLCEFIQLAHHSKPKLSIVEIVPGEADAPPGTRNSVLLDVLPYINAVVATADTGIWCMDESSARNITLDAEKRLSAHGISLPYIEVRESIKSVDEDGQLSTPTPSAIDVLLISFNDPSSVDVVRTVHATRKLLGTDGRFCLVLPSDEACIKQSIEELNDCKIVKISGSTLPSSTKGLSLLIGCPPLGQVENLNEDRRPRTDEEENKHVTILLSSEPSNASNLIARSLVQELSSNDYETSQLSWCSWEAPQEDKDLPSMRRRVVISLLDLDKPVLESLESEAQFSQLKSLILESESLLWVSGISDLDPGKSMASGLARVVRNEEPGLTFQTLHIQALKSTSNGSDLDKVAGNIFKVFRYGQDQGTGNVYDNEFVIENGLVNVDRIVEDESLSSTLQNMMDQNADIRATSRLPMGEAGPIKLSVQNAGLLDSLIFEHDPIAATDLGADEVEVVIYASSLNFRDVMTTMGKLPGTLLGFDCAGVVRRVAPGAAAAKFNVGDRVAMIQPGSHRTIHRAKLECVEHIPDSMTFEQAATIPVVHGTAWYALIKLAQARKGQSVLIHAAAGGVGQAAIMIAKHIGLEIFATVGSVDKRNLIVEKYGLEDDHIFNSRDLSFVSGIKRLSKGRGVDIILNSLSGEALRQTWHCIAPYGTFVEIGIQDILGNSRLDMRPFSGSTTFTFFDINRIIRERRDIMGEIMEGVFKMQREGTTGPVTPLSVYPISEMESAFRLMQTGKHLGKVVLSFAEEKQIVPVLTSRALPERLASFSLDPEAVYILAGGLGGLGRSLAKMMVDAGARNICFLSRSGATSQAARILMDELQQKACVQVLALKCDIVMEEDVRVAVQQAKQQLNATRIGGLLQCAMVLRDTLFCNMSYNDWVESTRPKVQGTWNLHHVLCSEQPASDLDFFVVLSSFAAIFGNRGQGNYAAAGAYQDGMAHFRRAQGLTAVTIDVGLMRDIGVLAERGMTAGLKEWEKPYGIRENELLNIVKMAIAGDVGPQLVTGLATGGSAMRAGLEKPWYLESDGKFAILAQTGVKNAIAQANSTAEQSDGPGGSSVPTQLAAVQTREEGQRLVLAALVARVAKMLQTTASEIDTDRFLHSYGIDSLAAIELVNWAIKECKSQITVFDIMAAVPMSSTAQKIADRSKLVQKGS